MIKFFDKVIEQNSFPDNSLLMKLDLSLAKMEFLSEFKIHWIYENDAELFSLICLKRHLDQKANKPISLELKYIPHARQDRVKNDEDIFTLKYFCEVINSLNFASVYVLDAHSNVSLSLLNNVIQYPVKSHILNAITDSKAEALFFPDEGAMKRYANISTLPFAFGMKRREWETGKILGLDVIQFENIMNKRVLIVDDICSRGGTFYHSAKTLKSLGTKNISLYVTHCENTILNGEIFTSELINQVYTTNSLVHCEEVANKVIYV